ncbi:hypothetical protein [Maricaulis parjimensis]|uniref:hypothetical protein n=1 Tax=Maricaulis parjimensis TaxID=144023 RepID=UPI0019393370|nr:hypothetical protein [Maricaulis parjimensis]
MAKLEDDAPQLDRSKRRFQLITALGIAALVGSAFGPDQYNVVELLPLFIGGCCAYYLWKFQALTEAAKGPLIVLFGVLLIGELGAINHGVQERRMLRGIREQCMHLAVANTYQCEQILSVVNGYLTPAPSGD